jgi:hypothetical protein
LANDCVVVTANAKDFDGIEIFYPRQAEGGKRTQTGDRAHAKRRRRGGGAGRARADRPQSEELRRRLSQAGAGEGEA